jgi:hypothetical protein
MNSEMNILVIFTSLDSEYDPATASLDYFIKKCKNLHIEKQNQLKILLQKYKYLFDSILGEFNIDPMGISLQWMDPNCKLVLENACTVPISLEQ